MARGPTTSLNDWANLHIILFAMAPMLVVGARMPDPQKSDSGIRLAEIVAALSLATDLSKGQPTD